MIRIDSEQLGALEIPEQALVDFPSGIPGFPAARQYCVLELKPGSRFKLLQCADDPKLAFVVTDPLVLDPGYPLDRVQRLAAPLGIEPDEPLAAACIVTVHPRPRPPTANMLAPLAMGLRTRVGGQVVLHDSAYRVRHEM